jgi:enoyl-CoA hydratase/carnithine racemase
MPHTVTGPGMTSREPTTLVVEREGAVATVTLANPPINLLDSSMFADLWRTMDALEGDPDVRVVILRSAVDGFFIAHFDVQSLIDIDRQQMAASATNPFQNLCERIHQMSTVTIAVIEGRIGGGGCELAASLDMRFCSPAARFNQPEVALGIIPGGSGATRLTRLLGRSRALEVILGCDDIDAGTAERYGLVNKVLPPENLDSYVHRLAGRIASFPPIAVHQAKDVVALEDGEMAASLQREHVAWFACVEDPASTRAMTAFLAVGGQTVEGEKRLADLLVAMQEQV